MEIVHGTNNLEIAKTLFEWADMLLALVNHVLCPCASSVHRFRSSVENNALADRNLCTAVEVEQLRSVIVDEDSTARTHGRVSNTNTYLRMR